MTSRAEEALGPQQPGTRHWSEREERYSAPWIKAQLHRIGRRGVVLATAHVEFDTWPAPRARFWCRIEGGRMWSTKTVTLWDECEGGVVFWAGGAQYRLERTR